LLATFLLLQHARELCGFLRSRLLRRFLGTLPRFELGRRRRRNIHESDIGIVAAFRRRRRRLPPFDA
jgi:hypothetical protein